MVVKNVIDKNFPGQPAVYVDLPLPRVPTPPPLPPIRDPTPPPRVPTPPPVPPIRVSHTSQSTYPATTASGPGSHSTAKDPDTTKGNQHPQVDRTLVQMGTMMMMTLNLPTEAREGGSPHRPQMTTGNPLRPRNQDRTQIYVHR